MPPAAIKEQQAQASESGEIRLLRFGFEQSIRVPSCPYVAEPWALVC